MGVYHGAGQKHRNQLYFQDFGWDLGLDLGLALDLGLDLAPSSSLFLRKSLDFRRKRLDCLRKSLDFLSERLGSRTGWGQGLTLASPYSTAFLPLPPPIPPLGRVYRLAADGVMGSYKIIGASPNPACQQSTYYW